MPRTQLTTNIARHHSPPERGKTQLFDVELSGLMVEIRPSGGRTYYLRYQDNRSKTRQLRLGKAQELTIPQAREKARTLLAQVRLGDDPAGPTQKPETAPKLAAFIADQYIPFVQRYKKSWELDERLLQNHVLPHLGNKRLDQIGRRDIEDVLRGFQENHKPASTNRILVLLRYVFNLAVDWEIPAIQSNPTHGVPLLKENNQRDRYLTAEETQRLFAELEHADNPLLRYIIPLLALTGARRGEVLHARWTDFDFEQRLWRIPEPKSGKARHVPLSGAVIDLLSHLDSSDHSPWLFPNPQTGKPFGSIYHSWNAARKRAGMPEVRIHDLRHSYASFLINNGYSLYHVQKLLGHTQIQTTQRYAHLTDESLLQASNDVAQILEPATPSLATGTDKRSHG